MDILKKIRPVILIVLPFLVLVLCRTLSNDRFKPEAERWIELSAAESNIINPGNIASISGDKLIINLGTGPGIPDSISSDQVRLSPASVLDKENLKLLNVRSRKVLLWSDEPGLAARTWMLLSQMGYKNIFILADIQNNEVFKKEFRPDTTVTAGTPND